jgi:tetratricopeptide (TPR) repeat protein
MLRHSPLPSFRFVLLLLALSCACAGSAAAKSGEWIQIETPDFVAYSDAPARDVTEFAVRYSAFQHAFRELFDSPGHNAPPSRLVLFRRESVFAAHVPPPRTAKTHLVNYSVEVDGSSLLALALSGDYDNAIARTFEFETVWALRRMGYNVPMWLSQGAGEVLATIEVKKNRVLLGREATDHADQFLVKRDLLPWPRFFAVGESSPEYAGQDATGAFHSQAWALMHWILFKDEHSRERFLDLVNRLKTTPALSAVEAVMGVSADQFRSEIEKHLRNFKQARTLPFDEASIKASLKISPANEGDALVQTSNLLAAAGRMDESNRELDRAAQLAANHAEVKEALARRAVRENRLTDAAQLYREAIAAGSRNYSAYLNSAAARLDSAMKGSVDQPGSGSADIDEAVTEIRRAIALSHGNTEAYRLLGRAFWVKAQISPENVSELSPGVASGEDGQRVRYYRALLNSRLGRPDEAVQDLQQILADSDVAEPERRRARERLDDENFRITTSAVKSLVGQKNFAEAQHTLSVAEQQATSPATIARYRNLHAWLDEEAAWNDLVVKADGKKWSELGNAAQLFLERFPESPRTTAVQKLKAEAQRMVDEKP